MDLKNDNRFLLASLLAGVVVSVAAYAVAPLAYRESGEALAIVSWSGFYLFVLGGAAFVHKFYGGADKKEGIGIFAIMTLMTSIPVAMSAALSLLVLSKL